MGVDTKKGSGVELFHAWGSETDHWFQTEFFDLECVGKFLGVLFLYLEVLEKSFHYIPYSLFRSTN